MTGAYDEDDIAMAVEIVANHAVAARSQQTDPLDRATQSGRVRDAWQLLTSEPFLHGFLTCQTHYDPYGWPKLGPNRTRIKFLQEVRRRASFDVDVWDAGIRAGFVLSVPPQIAKRLAKSVFRGNSTFRLKSQASGMAGQISAAKLGS
jgi:hypothetical protein